MKPGLPTPLSPRPCSSSAAKNGPRAPFVAVEGVLQRQDGVISVKARKVTPLPAAAIIASRDFH
jgi:hypothetical protein